MTSRFSQHGATEAVMNFGAGMAGRLTGDFFRCDGLGYMGVLGSLAWGA